MPRTRTSPAPGAGNFATGQYTGNGNPTQAIVGVGFRPKFVWVWGQDNVLEDHPAMKADVDGAFAEFFQSGVGHRYLTDMIVSLDADGFTVGDGTGYGNVLNINGVTYAYNCWR